MQQRNVLSLFVRLMAFCLGSLPLLPVTPAHAQLAMSQEQPGSSPSSTNDFADLAGGILPRQEIRLAPQLTTSIDLTTPADDLWERIRNGFAMTNLNDSLVLHYQQWYQNRPEALRRMVERSRPYLHYIVEELEARGMPTEIALLPMVESSFNPMAYSRANAAGLWQFIPATGKRFKLEQNWWRDERRNVVASTNAALDYLQTIYEMHGDWHLALASYNWGEGAVKRAVEKNESRGLPTDYPNLTMPNETRHYVPKLQALKNIFGNPQLLSQLGIPAIANDPYFAMLETPAPMDVKTAARLANMSIDEFQRLNPSHNRPVIRPDTPMVIPTDKVETFRSNLENHAAPLSNWQAYTVTSTERLEQIANRFDTTATELARVNGLSERVRLAPGSTLLVPGVSSGPGLANLLATASPQQIIATEPVISSCAKKGKGKSACDKQAAAHPANGETKLSRVPAGSAKEQSRHKDQGDRRSQPKNESRNKAEAAKASNGKARGSVTTSKDKATSHASNGKRH